MDISDQKIIGKFALNGKVKYSSIKQNMMLMVVEAETSDQYYFLVLNNNRKVDEPLILCQSIHQKSKSDCFEFINISKKESQIYTESKRKDEKEVSEVFPTEVTCETCSILFTSVKEKEKMEIFKI